MPPPKGQDCSKSYEALFSEQFGKARWKKVRAALLTDASHVALVNTFAQLAGTSGHLTEPLLPEELSPWQAWDSCVCLRRKVDKGPYAPPDTTPSGLHSHFWLEPASLLPPMLLAPIPGHAVLDMCASPGGKSLLLALSLFSHTTASSQPRSDHVMPQKASSTQRQGSYWAASGQLPGSQPTEVRQAAESAPSSDESQDAANGTGQADGVVGVTAAQAVPHPSNSRLTVNVMEGGKAARLASMMSEYIPLALLSDCTESPKVKLSQQAADKYWCRQEQEVYHRVLLDAPCSSDRHALQQSTTRRGVIAQSSWSVPGCKKMADMQLQLLLAGLRALIPGGRLVYSTCSMATLENDEVITRVLARLPPGAVTIERPLLVELPGCLITPGQLEQVFGAETTVHGFQVLPDRSGAGPMYVCVLTKVLSNEENAKCGVTGRLGFSLMKVSNFESGGDTSDEDSDE